MDMELAIILILNAAMWSYVAGIYQGMKGN